MLTSVLSRKVIERRERLGKLRPLYIDADFKEEEHPRASSGETAGQFVKKGQEESSKSNAEVSKKDNLFKNATFYKKLSEKEIPSKTQKAYKLMVIRPKQYKGLMIPLYARPDKGIQAFTLGEWYRAERQRPSIGGRQLADRSGIHAVNLPIFSQGKAKPVGGQRVWVEVEMPAMDPKTQEESNSQPKLKNGMSPGISKRLIGPNEAYNYKTNPTAKGAQAWPIAGSMKAVKILSDEEVKKILKASGSEEHIENSLTGMTTEETKRLNDLYRENSKPVYDAWLVKSFKDARRK
jgi:hypothetical protein